MKVERSSHRLHGGIHPDTHKDRTAALPVADVPVSALAAAPLHVSLHQNIGAPSKTVVAVGDRVLRGRLDLTDGTARLRLTGGQSNGVLSSAIGCDALAVIPAGSGPIAPGTLLKGYLI